MENGLTRRQALLAASSGAFAVSASGCATDFEAYRSPAPLPQDYFDATPSPFQQFAAAADEPQQRLTFSLLDDVYAAHVIDLGPSDRIAPALPGTQTGSRIRRGHASDYRLEGSRIPFELFSPTDAAAWTDARQSLEALPSQRPLSAFGWLDQMAFWFNLHNVALVEQIAKRYPVASPYDMRVGSGGDRLYDAKIVTIQGARLSLRDIRIEIVYRHWRQPSAIYGFFHGVVGGPKLLGTSFTGANLAAQLDESGNDFVNSLRGVRAGNGAVRVSTIYGEAAPLFPDFERDLRQHLLAYADPAATELLDADQPLRLEQYDPTIVDLSGGDTTGPARALASGTAFFGDAAATTWIAQLAQSTASADSGRLPPHAIELVRDYTLKLERQELRARRSPREGAVTIRDLPDRPVE